MLRDICRATYAATCRKTSRPGARVGSDAETHSHSGDDIRHMIEVTGDFLIPHNEIADLSGVALDHIRWNFPILPLRSGTTSAT